MQHRTKKLCLGIFAAPFLSFAVLASSTGLVTAQSTVPEAAPTPLGTATPTPVKNPPPRLITPSPLPPFFVNPDETTSKQKGQYQTDPPVPAPIVVAKPPVKQIDPPLPAPYDPPVKGTPKQGKRQPGEIIIPPGPVLMKVPGSSVEQIAPPVPAPARLKGAPNQEKRQASPTRSLIAPK